MLGGSDLPAARVAEADALLVEIRRLYRQLDALPPRERPDTNRPQAGAVYLAIEAAIRALSDRYERVIGPHRHTLKPDTTYRAAPDTDVPHLGAHSPKPTARRPKPAPVLRPAAVAPPPGRVTVSIAQATAVVDVSRRTIYNWLKAGKVEYVRTAGGSVRIFRDTLLRGSPNQEAAAAKPGIG